METIALMLAGLALAGMFTYYRALRRAANNSWKTR
jgi:hypothetical protein